MDFEIQQLLPAWFTSSQAATSDFWLKDLSFKQGELIEIVAPSGSGKTSLIHFLYGMRKDYTGIIRYNNKELSTAGYETMAQYRKDNLSVVFQDMRLFNSQTVFENIEIKRQLAPFHDSGLIKEMASRLGIADKLDALCANCSYGEQQRIAIIRALMQPFDILLLDEPFSHLDRNNAEKAMKLILGEAGKRNATIIFADLEQTSFYPKTRLFYL
ncbi:ATP-binding cassette domain-containing protein [Flavitalea sp.]|nr:ATP-binding cassette domain-containing protein [Flavitalea sp.]